MSQCLAGEGPSLDALLRRLSECPAEFLLPPDVIDAAALVADHFRAVGTDPPPRLALPAAAGALQVVAVATWLLRDPWFLAHAALAPRLPPLFAETLPDLATVTTAGALVQDADRREELVRLCLAALGLRPAGETEAQAADRLTTLDSLERVRVIRETRAAEARARALREQMAREAALAAAARYSPE